MRDCILGRDRCETQALDALRAVRVQVEGSVSLMATIDVVDVLWWEARSMTLALHKLKVDLVVVLITEKLATFYRIA